MTLTRTLPIKSRVAYCSACKLYVEEKEAGKSCPGCAVDHVFPRKMRLRVGYICPECECRNIFFDREEYLNHRCENYGLRMSIRWNGIRGS